MVVLTLLSLNLFIAVILNGYFETLDQHAQFLNPDMMQIYRESWSKHDPDAKGFMSSTNFKKLLFDIGPPLGWGADDRAKPERQERYVKLASYLLVQSTTDMDQNADGKSMLYFNDVLDAIVTLNVIREETTNHLDEIDLNASIHTEQWTSSSEKSSQEEHNSIPYSSRIDRSSRADKDQKIVR
jgi:hypothetical protein